MTFGANDMGVFFGEMAEVVTFGAASFKALYDIASADLDDGSGLVVVGKTPVLTFATDDAGAAGIKRGSAVTVRGIAYLVSSPPRVEDDGLLSKVFLELAS